MNLIEISSDGWADKTLLELHIDASSVPNGLASQELIGPDGRRTVLVIGVVAPKTIALLEEAIDWTDAGPPGNWTTLTLRDLVLKCGPQGGLACERMSGADDSTKAIAIAAVGSMAVQIVEGLFRLS